MHNNNIHRTYIIFSNPYKQRIQKNHTSLLHPLENAPYFHLTAKKNSNQNQQMYKTDVKIIITLAVSLLI